MATSPQPVSGMWHAYSTQDVETGLYIAHCLDLNLKVAGRDDNEAWWNLKKVIKAHYEYCFEFDQEGLKLTASAKQWAEYNAAFAKALVENPESITIERIELTLRAPRVPDQIMPLSCQRVDIGQTATAH